MSKQIGVHTTLHNNINSPVISVVDDIFNNTISAYANEDFEEGESVKFEIDAIDFTTNYTNTSFISTAIAIDDNELYCALAGPVSPYLTILKKVGENFIEGQTTIDVFPTGQPLVAEFCDDYLVISHNVTPFMTVYKRNGDTFNKLAFTTDIDTMSYMDITKIDNEYYICVTQSNKFIKFYKINQTTQTVESLSTSPISGRQYGKFWNGVFFAGGTTNMLLFEKDVNDFWEYKQVINATGNTGFAIDNVNNIMFGRGNNFENSFLFYKINSKTDFEQINTLIKNFDTNATSAINKNEINDKLLYFSIGSKPTFNIMYKFDDSYYLINMKDFQYLRTNSTSSIFKFTSNYLFLLYPSYLNVFKLKTVDTIKASKINKYSDYSKTKTGIFGYTKQSVTKNTTALFNFFK